MELSLTNILLGTLVLCLGCGLFGYISFHAQGLERFPWDPPPKSAMQQKQEAKNAAKQSKREARREAQ